MIDHVYLVANGDQRLSANRLCWPAQQRFEALLVAALESRGVTVTRAHPAETPEGHGFIASQAQGLAVFAGIPADAPVVMAEGVWMFSQQVLGGLLRHRGPVLTVANWEGEWPGLVGLLNLNASLTKAGRPYETVWSRTFDDAWFGERLGEWLRDGVIRHDLSHVKPFDGSSVTGRAREVADEVVAGIRAKGVIMGVLDEGCMGMYNGIIPDELLFPLSVFKERMSQSALYAETLLVTEEEAVLALDWLTGRGMTFQFGTDGETELTREQVILQLRMYAAIARMADRFGVDVIGIQYQLGLADVLPASDLAEGLLNNADRPPVTRADGSVIRDGEPITLFNEADEGSGLDALITTRVSRALGQPVETTLHDVRWGDADASGTVGDFVWVFEISGAVPPSFHIDGYAGTDSRRQPALYFKMGGGTVRGISRPGELVWSRIWVEGGALHMDLGRATVVELPESETERRWAATTPEWPIMHAVLHGVDRDQFMARHKSNHIQVSYASDAAAADEVLAAKALAAQQLGLNVNLCGITGE
ncbi:fucose isomerase [Actinoplanes bogorensis]|uniref:Fucose isomerase n=1 Tax=Paractinoplanes bogorensis TaxID=1610840 RepID=A0ABS5YWV0_9ACTN|nr:fucose isomerase [Actinoplanes bogorensis]MBU2667916.1 fucose isomerase [Actinoplanes bogorensis]